MLPLSPHVNDYYGSEIKSFTSKRMKRKKIPTVLTSAQAIMYYQLKEDKQQKAEKQAKKKEEREQKRKKVHTRKEASC